MMKTVRQKVPSPMSLKSEDVNGFRKIKHILLERANLDDIEDQHLEPHERKAVTMFKEFEKRENKRKSGSRMPIFG